MADGPAILISVAQGITDALSDHDFGIQPFKPRRSYADWDETLADVGELHIDVVPVRHTETELTERKAIRYLCDTDIGARKRITKDQQTPCGDLQLEELDRLVFLVEQINEFFVSDAMLRLPSFEAAVWNATEIRASYVRKHLRENRQFTGLLRVSYEVVKDL